MSATDWPYRKDQPQEPKATEVRVYDIPNAVSFSTPPVPVLVVDPERCRVFDAEAKRLYLEDLAISGRKYRASQIAGCNMVTVTKHRKSDPEFAAAEEEALSAYRDRVRATVQNRAIEGVLEPIIGRVAKDVDGIIGYKRRYSDQLLVMEAKRVDEEYRDKSTVDVNVKAGVLVLGAPRSTQDWEATHSGQKLPEDPLEGLPGVNAGMIANVGTKMHTDDDE